MKSDVYQQLVLLMCHFNCSSENMIHLWYIIHNINNYIAYQHSGMAEGLLGLWACIIMKMIKRSFKTCNNNNNINNNILSEISWFFIVPAQIGFFFCFCPCNQKLIWFCLRIAFKNCFELYFHALINLIVFNRRKGTHQGLGCVSTRDSFGSCFVWEANK